MRLPLFSFLLAGSLLIASCGTITGIPSHGGGKRFAVEQEIVAASARAAAKNLNLSALKGRKVALWVTVMGDQGAGNFVGGRYNIEALIRGDYLNTPSTIASNQYPVVSATTTTTTGNTVSTTVSDNPLNAPSTSTVRTDGSNSSVGGGVRYQGQGSFDNETLITNPGDVVFLQNVLQAVFFLRGVEVVDPKAADTDVFILVDVFGTVRSRNDWHILNQERLIAKTAFEVMAIDRSNKKMLLRPTTSSFEADYVEQYALWAGPFETRKVVKPSEKLLVDFSDIDSEVPVTSAKHSSGITAPVMLPKKADPYPKPSDNPNLAMPAVSPAVNRSRE